MWIPTITCGLLLSSLLVAQGGGTPPQSNPPTGQQGQQGQQGQRQGEQGQPGQKQGQKGQQGQSDQVQQDQDGRRVIPGGKGFHQAGLVDDNGNPVAGSEGKMVDAEGGIPGGDRPAPNAAAKGPAPGDHLFRPVVSVKPRRLAPGQQGEMFVLVTLGKGGHLVPAGAVAELRIVDTAGPFRFGVPTLEPPQTARLSANFKGQPVYEETLLFRVPLTVRAEAKVQQYAVPGVVRLALTNGQTGEYLGLFETALQGGIRVGKPLPAVVAPRPTRGGSAGDGAGDGAGSAERAAPTAGSPASGAPGRAPGGGSRGTGTLAAGATPGDTVPGAPAQAPELQDGSWDPLMIGGVIAMLLLVVVLLRRRG